MRDPYADLDEEINMGKEARQEAREWARTLLFVSVCAAVLLACVWLGGAFDLISCSFCAPPKIGNNCC